MTTEVQFTADARQGALYSVQVTLGAGGAVTDVQIPNDANGFRIYPSAEIRFAINEDPAAEATQSDDVTLAELAVGGHAFASVWETRILSEGTGRELHLRAGAGSEVVNVEFF